MRLEDLYSVIDDYIYICVYDKETGNMIAKYNGKDSIPLELNDKEITNLYPIGNTFEVYLRM